MVGDAHSLEWFWWGRSFGLFVAESLPESSLSNPVEGIVCRKD